MTDQCPSVTSSSRRWPVQSNYSPEWSLGDRLLRPLPNKLTTSVSWFNATLTTGVRADQAWGPGATVTTGLTAVTSSMSGQSSRREDQRHRCQIWHRNWVRLAPNGTNLWLFEISFITFLNRNWSLKVPDLSHLGPIWPNLDGKFDIPGLLGIWHQCWYKNCVKI